MTRDNIRRHSAEVILALVIAIQPFSLVWAAEHLLLRGEGGDVVAVTDLQVKDGDISGLLLNRAPRPVRDVQLLIRYGWRWRNEFRPQEDTLSRAVYHTVEKEIPAGGGAPFNYKPPEPLPSRPDGYFETSVAIAGFTEVILPKQ